MDLPTPNFIRGLRADIGALHHTLHSLALSDAESASSCQFDASPIDGEEWVTAPQQLVEEVFGEIVTRTWYGGAVRTADQSAVGEAAVVADHGFARKSKYIEALRARLGKRARKRKRRRRASQPKRQQRGCSRSSLAARRRRTTRRPRSLLSVR